MKVVKWGVHGTGTCIGPGILLSVTNPNLDGCLCSEIGCACMETGCANIGSLYFAVGVQCEYEISEREIKQHQLHTHPWSPERD